MTTFLQNSRVKFHDLVIRHVRLALVGHSKLPQHSSTPNPEPPALANYEVQSPVNSLLISLSRYLTFAGFYQLTIDRICKFYQPSILISTILTPLSSVPLNLLSLIPKTK